MTILTDTDHSYSGISDLIHNEPEKIKDFLVQLTNFYGATVARQKELEQELENVKHNRAIAVSDFVFAMKAMDKTQLVYQVDGEIIVIDMIDYEQRRINIEKYVLSDI